MHASKGFVLAVGSTGAGKSQHLKLITGSGDIGVADRNAANSCTKGTSFYDCKDNSLSNCVFIDTMGAQDTEEINRPDSQILEDASKILKEAYDKDNGNSKWIKILWFIHDTKKAFGAIQTQARFIGAFNNNEHKENNVWDSVLIICREPSNIKESVQGALDAASRVGCNNINKLKFTGHKCIEWLNKDDQKKWLEMEKMNAQMAKQFFEMSFVYHENEILSKLSSLITELKEFPIFFQDNKCKKCGIKGDPRFCAAKCHTKSEKYHKEKSILRHKENSKIVKEHPGSFNIVLYHPKLNKPLIHPSPPVRKHENNCERINKYHGSPGHSGQLESKQESAGEETYETEECPNCGSSSVYRYQCTTGSFLGGFRPECGHCGENIYTGYYMHCDDCCTNESSDHSVMHKRCSRLIKCCRKTKTRTIFNTIKYWNCCGNGEGDSGCVCNDCNNKLDSTGCHESITYRCRKNIGCQVYYECCNKNDQFNKNGCRYQCCPHLPMDNNNGCQEKEDTTYSCCNSDDPNDGCKKYWNCCNGNEDNQGCEFYYQCCQTVCSIDNNENELKNPSKDCGLRCQKCKQNYGKDAKDPNGNGCELIENGNNNHEWEKIK